MTSAADHSVDQKAFVIGVLSVTACILFVGLILISQPPAYAIGMNDRGGDYIMLTQQLSTTTEGVVVIDAAAKRMVIYEYDYNNHSLEMLRQVPLDQLPTPRAPAEEPQPTPRRRR